MRRAILLLMLCACFRPVTQEDPIDTPPPASTNQPAPEPAPEPEPSNLLRGLVGPDCGPADGPALYFDFASETLQCPQGKRDGMTVMVWSTGELKIGTFTLGPGYSGIDGTSNLGGVVGEAVSMGTLSIDSVTDTTVEGRIDATYELGTKVNAPFKVQRCLQSSPHGCG